jgi:hypothetical protein
MGWRGKVCVIAVPSSMCCVRRAAAAKTPRGSSPPAPAPLKQRSSRLAGPAAPAAPAGRHPAPSRSVPAGQAGTAGEGSRERRVGPGGLLGGTGGCAVKSGPVKSGFIFPILAPAILPPTAPLITLIIQPMIPSLCSSFRERLSHRCLKPHAVPGFLRASLGSLQATRRTVDSKEESDAGRELDIVDLVVIHNRDTHCKGRDDRPSQHLVHYEQAAPTPAVGRYINRQDDISTSPSCVLLRCC